MQHLNTVKPVFYINYFMGTVYGKKGWLMNKKYST